MNCDDEVLFYQVSTISAMFYSVLVSKCKISNQENRYVTKYLNYAMHFQK